VKYKTRTPQNQLIELLTLVFVKVISLNKDIICKTWWYLS